MLLKDKLNPGILKACVRYFLSSFYFSTNDSPSETWKMFLFHLKSCFCSWDIQIFVFLFSCPFSPVSHCFRGWSKKNLKVYDLKNCLNKTLITYFAWYLGKEKRCGIETSPIDRELNKEPFYEKIIQKIVPNPFLVLLNNPKQPLDTRNSFKNKVFWKRIIKKPLKS